MGKSTPEALRDCLGTALMELGKETEALHKLAEPVERTLP